MYNEQHFENMKIFWNLLHPDDYIMEDETIRMVVFQKNIKTEQPLIYTSQQKINTFSQLRNFIEHNAAKYGEDFSLAISSSLFKYEADKAPGIYNFSRTKSIILDFDSKHSLTGEKVILKNDQNLIQCSYALLTQVQDIMKRVNADFSFFPVAAALTGAGLQLIYQFDREIIKEEANVLYDFLKDNLKNVSIKNSFIVKDILDQETTVEYSLHLDPSSFDISHVQRCIGIWHNKHKTFSHFLYMINQENKQLVNCDTILKHIKIHANKPTASSKQFTNIEYEICRNIKVVDALGDKLILKEKNKSYSIFKCPFHDPDNAGSFVVYHNEDSGGVQLCVDFHDEQVYNVVSLYAKLNNLSNSVAIQSLAQKHSITLSAAAKKEIKGLEATELASDIMQDIDTENYIYYRPSNNRNKVTVRRKKDGLSVSFDKMESLVIHLMKNHLGIKQYDKAFKDSFKAQLEQEVIIEAFENFRPGAGTIFKEGFITYVNTWVPNDNYKEILEATRDMQRIDLDELDAIIKDECKMMDIYLNQLCQYGDRKWFLNWLAASVQFKYVPVVPIFFGVQGTGKDTFVREILNWYFAQEYVGNMSSERIGQQFNSMLTGKTMVVLNESDMGSSRQLEILKYITGADRIVIEKKGVDATYEDRCFNVMVFSNKKTPILHTASERRFQYYYQDITLDKTLENHGITYEEFIEALQGELKTFFMSLKRATVAGRMASTINRDGNFYRQILTMHPLGKLLLAITEQSWNELIADINSDSTESAEIAKMNIELINNIKTEFMKENRIQLVLINKYLKATARNFPFSMTDFLRVNNLQQHGIYIDVTDAGETYLHVELDKIKKLISRKNVLNIEETPLVKSSTKLEKVMVEAEPINPMTQSHSISSIMPSNKRQPLPELIPIASAPTLIKELLKQPPSAPPQNNSNIQMLLNAQNNSSILERTQ